MKVRVSIDINIPEGDYELTWKNVSNPGEPIELNTLTTALRLVLADFNKQQSGELEGPKKRMDN